MEESSSLTNTPQQQQLYYQSTSYYAYTDQHNQQQQYPYYPSDYTTSYHQQPQYHKNVNDSTSSIYPPGHPIPSTHLSPPNYDHTLLQNQQISYHDQQHQLNWDANGGGFAQLTLNEQSQYAGGGRRGGRGRGRGRGRGKGRVALHGSGRADTSQAQAEPSWPPIAWCELCRADCNSLEILEQHKNGKKHKRNLQIQEECQNLNKVVTGMQTKQTTVSESNPETSHIEKLNIPTEKQLPPEKIDGSPEKQASPDNVLAETSLVGLTSELKKKRKAKRKRTSDCSNKPARLSKPKKAPGSFLCELCNIKCESQVVFDSHLAGKKHLANLQGYHDYQAVLGVAVLQALCQDPYALSQVLAAASASLPATILDSISPPIPAVQNEDKLRSSHLDSQTVTELDKEKLTPILNGTGVSETLPLKPLVGEAFIAPEYGIASSERGYIPGFDSKIEEPIQDL